MTGQNEPAGLIGGHILAVAALLLFGSLTAFSQYDKCLPADVTPTTTVRFLQRKQLGSSIEQPIPITVTAELKQQKARCRHGKLRSRNGREIRFYQRQGCWGNPPVGYLTILEDQKKEIAELRRKFTVIEITCETGYDRP